MTPSENHMDTIDEKVKAFVLDYEHFPCGIAVIQNDGFSTLLRANPAFYKIIGHTEEEFQKNYNNHMNDILIDDFFDIVQKQPTDKDYNMEWDIRLRTADGSVRWIHDVAHYQAQTNAFFVVFTDITDKMVTSSSELSFEAFQAKHEILLYLSKYTTKSFIVTELDTDKVVYMSPSAMALSGFQSEHDWLGKTYVEIAFGVPENIPQGYYDSLQEDTFTVREYYNTFHKKFTRAEIKIFSIPTLHQKMRLTIINDITAEKKLEQRMAFRTTLYHCMESLFTVGATNRETQEAYFEILTQLVSFYHGDGAFFYKFANNTHLVEASYKVLADGETDTSHNIQVHATDEQIQMLQAIASAKASQKQDVLDSFASVYKATLAQLNLNEDTDCFTCSTINDAQGRIIAFLGITNPQYNKADKELINLLSRFICMFIEHEQDDLHREEALALEAASKANLMEKCAKNFQDLDHAQKNVQDTLTALCHHYDADFAIIISRTKNTPYGISHVSSGIIPDFKALQESSHFMGNWLETFEKHTHFASDLDFDDSNSPMVKKMLQEKFGIYNFVASPMRDANGDLTGLLIVNNLNLINRSHLMVHVVANSISDYLTKITLYKTTQLEPTTELSNKLATQTQISTLLEKGVKGTLFIVDIDNFKNLNDTLGHQVGDQAIMDLAGVLKKISRTTDIVGRVGGDEFMVFCNGLTCTDSIHKKARQILENCNLTYENSHIQIKLSSSIGVCPVDNHCNTFHALYTNADYALYRSKKEGKNQYHIYTPNDNG